MPGKSKKGGGLEVGSAYKMKYNNSAFPFKSPSKENDVSAKMLEKEQEVHDANFIATNKALNEAGKPPMTRDEYNKGVGATGNNSK